MGIKRQLKKQVRKAEKEILENDGGFRERFIAEYCDKPKSNNKKKTVIISLSSAFACVVCAVLLILFLPNVGILSSKTEKKYFEENRVTVESNVEEINTNLNNIKFNAFLDYNYTVERIYDSKYNETLLFRLKIINDLTTINIEIYINKNYNDKKIVTDSSLQNVNKIDFYLRDNSNDEDYLYQAQFTHSGISAYIEYEELKVNEGDDGFIPFLESTFTVS